MSEFKPGKGMNDFSGFAFPLHVDPLNAIDYGGMSLRDYFAAKALQGLISRNGYNSYQSLSMHAYDIADAMLKVRDLK